MSQYAILILVILLITSVNVIGAEKPILGLKGVYSITSFGAKGDGKTDDTAAVKAGHYSITPLPQYTDAEQRGGLHSPPPIDLRAVHLRLPLTTGSERPGGKSSME